VVVVVGSVILSMGAKGDLSGLRLFRLLPERWKNQLGGGLLVVHGWVGFDTESLHRFCERGVKMGEPTSVSGGTTRMVEVTRSGQYLSMKTRQGRFGEKPLSTQFSGSWGPKEARRPSIIRARACRCGENG